MTIVDIWGRTYHVHRRRGQKPVCKTVLNYGGRIPIALTQILITIAEHLEHGNVIKLSTTLINLVDASKPATSE